MLDSVDSNSLRSENTRQIDIPEQKVGPLGRTRASFVRVPFVAVLLSPSMFCQSKSDRLQVERLMRSSRIYDCCTV
jgi:hypothetical protein